MSSATSKQIHLRDGRALGYAEFGDPAGKPVFFFHGFPGSRLQRYPDDAIAIASGARIITIDRPGLGLSSFQPGRKLLDWPGDVVELAYALARSDTGNEPPGPYCSWRSQERTVVAHALRAWPGSLEGSTRPCWSQQAVATIIAPGRQRCVCAA